jgi:hypothetical protein
MNDELNNVINEIEESIVADESVASGQDTEATSAEDELDVEAELKTSSEPKKSASEIAKEKQEAWANKILSGKKTLEDLASTPSDKWMLSSVKQRLGIVDSVDDIESRLSAYEAKKQFDKDTETLKSYPIEAKKETLKLYKEYVELGVSPEKALRKSMEKAGGIVEAKETERKSRVEAGQLPTGKTSGGQTVYTGAQVAKMNQADYNRIRDLELKGEVVIKL